MIHRDPPPATNRTECYGVFHTCVSVFKEALKGCSDLLLWGPFLCAQYSLKSVHCCLQILWLEGKFIYIGSCFCACQLALWHDKNILTSKGISCCWSFGMVKKRNPQSVRVSVNSFLTINYHSCVCLDSLVRTWSLTASQLSLVLEKSGF